MCYQEPTRAVNTFNRFLSVLLAYIRTRVVVVGTLFVLLLYWLSILPVIPMLAVYVSTAGL